MLIRPRHDTNTHTQEFTSARNSNIPSVYYFLKRFLYTDFIYIYIFFKGGPIAAFINVAIGPANFFFFKGGPIAVFF